MELRLHGFLWEVAQSQDFPMFEMIPHSPFIVQTAR